MCPEFRSRLHIDNIHRQEYTGPPVVLKVAFATGAAFSGKKVDGLISVRLSFHTHATEKMGMFDTYSIEGD